LPSSALVVHELLPVVLRFNDLLRPRDDRAAPRTSPELVTDRSVGAPAAPISIVCLTSGGDLLPPG
jgi:hypothetical protein